VCVCVRVCCVCIYYKRGVCVYVVYVYAISMWGVCVCFVCVCVCSEQVSVCGDYSERNRRRTSDNYVSLC